MYHAKVTDGRTDDQNAVIMESFFEINGNCHVLLASVAFGINIPDNRRVIHFASCRKMEGYVQESCRGGQDGGAVLSCILTLDAQDSMSVRA